MKDRTTRAGHFLPQETGFGYEAGGILLKSPTALIRSGGLGRIDFRRYISGVRRMIGIYALRFLWCAA